MVDIKEINDLILSADKNSDYQASNSLFQRSLPKEPGHQKKDMSGCQNYGPLLVP